MQINVLEKLPQLVALLIFQSLYLSCGESLDHDTVSYYGPHLTYFWKHYIYYKKDTKVGSQNLATKFGFVPDS